MTESQSLTLIYIGNVVTEIRDEILIFSFAVRELLLLFFRQGLEKSVEVRLFVFADDKTDIFYSGFHELLEHYQQCGL